MLLLAGCGDSTVRQISGAPTPAPAATVSPRLMSGIWGGYFPGSSIQKPDHGLEFHFDSALRQDGSLQSAGFVHRANREATRHHLTVPPYPGQPALPHCRGWRQRLSGAR